MKPFNILFILFILIVSYPLSNSFYAQNNSIILDGGYFVLNGGTATESIYIVVNQQNTSGIERLSSGGFIHSENQYNYIKWLSNSSTGTYVFPFGVRGNPEDYIPSTFKKTAGNSSVSMSTWATNTQNLPYPAASNVGAVNNMNGITAPVEYAIDRFWDIQAKTTTADLTFSFRGIENTTSYPNGLVQAQHWNGSSWGAPVGPGSIGVTTGIGIAGPFKEQSSFSPWVLITSCPVDSITQNLTICEGDSIIVGTNTYLTSGTYRDDLINISGCDSIVVTNLTVLDIPIINITSNSPLCEGETLNLNVSTVNGASYQWSGPNGFISQGQNPTINEVDLLNSGTYQVITTVGNNCADTSQINIIVNPLPVINSSILDEICGSSNGQITITATSPNLPLTYLWNNGSINTYLTGLSEGNYQVIVTDASSCSQKASFQIINNINDCNCFVYVPNAFSPNGDGNNDIIPVLGECVSNLTFKIFNRWGNLVFETNKLNDGWDGYYKGELQNTGIYVYVLEATFINGESTKESGDISLIR